MGVLLEKLRQREQCDVTCLTQGTRCRGGNAPGDNEVDGRVRASVEAVATSLIHLLVRDDATDATARVVDVTLASGDQMNVAVKDGLACVFTTVDANVEGRNFRVG